VTRDDRRAEGLGGGTSIYLSLNGKAPASKERYSIRWDKWFHANLVVLRVFTL
jgi:hypothetical protein